jgi:hypothetical protein
MSGTYKKTIIKCTREDGSEFYPFFHMGAWYAGNSPDSCVLFGGGSPACFVSSEFGRQTMKKLGAVSWVVENHCTLVDPVNYVTAFVIVMHSDEDPNGPYVAADSSTDYATHDIRQAKVFYDIQDTKVWFAEHAKEVPFDTFSVQVLSLVVTANLTLNKFQL